MTAPVTSKAQMYRLLNAGRFGNTIRRWSNWPDWERERPESAAVWGVQTAGAAGGGPLALNVPTDGVVAKVLEFERLGYPVWISAMIDCCCTVTAWFDVYESAAGLVVEGVEYPKTAEGWTWRRYMYDPTVKRRWEGTAARLTLARHLNENSRDDLRLLLDEYPDHVVELSATDRCFGTVPHRNAIVWEVRRY